MKENFFLTKLLRAASKGKLKSYDDDDLESA